MNIQSVNYGNYNSSNSVNQTNFKKLPNFNGTLVTRIKAPDSTDLGALMRYTKSRLFQKIPNLPRQSTTWNRTGTRVYTKVDSDFDKPLDELAKELSTEFKDEPVDFVYDPRTPEALEAMGF